MKDVNVKQINATNNKSLALTRLNHIYVCGGEEGKQIILDFAYLNTIKADDSVHLRDGELSVGNELKIDDE